MVMAHHYDQVQKDKTTVKQQQNYRYKGDHHLNCNLIPAINMAKVGLAL